MQQNQKPIQAHQQPSRLSFMYIDLQKPVGVPTIYQVNHESLFSPWPPIVHEPRELIPKR